MNLYNMDAWDFIKQCPDKCFDAVITDPLYDASINMDEIRRICKGNIIMFCSPSNPFFKPDELAYWIKTPSTKNFSKKLGRFVEWILIERHGDTFNTDLHWSNYTGVYDDMLLEKPLHPYEKPESLLKRLVGIYTKRGDKVFDPFFGSGSTGKACNVLGRNFTGCEIVKTYYDLLARQTTVYHQLLGQH